jgi:hypothetical protein
MARVVLTKGLTQFTGGERELELEVSTIRQLLRLLGERYPALAPHLEEADPARERGPRHSEDRRRLTHAGGAKMRGGRRRDRQEHRSARPVPMPGPHFRHPRDLTRGSIGCSGEAQCCPEKRCREPAGCQRRGALRQESGASRHQAKVNPIAANSSFVGPCDRGCPCRPFWRRGARTPRIAWTIEPRHRSAQWVNKRLNRTALVKPVHDGWNTKLWHRVPAWSRLQA